MLKEKWTTMNYYAPGIVVSWGIKNNGRLRNIACGFCLAGIWTCRDFWIDLQTVCCCLLDWSAHCTDVAAAKENSVVQIGVQNTPVKALIPLGYAKAHLAEIGLYRSDCQHRTVWDPWLMKNNNLALTFIWKCWTYFSIMLKRNSEFCYGLHVQGARCWVP